MYAKVRAPAPGEYACSAGRGRGETLLQVARQFVKEADPERVLSSALDQAMHLLNADGAQLYRWDETDEVLTWLRGRDAVRGRGPYDAP